MDGTGQGEIPGARDHGCLRPLRLRDPVEERGDEDDSGQRAPGLLGPWVPTTSCAAPTGPGPTTAEIKAKLSDMEGIMSIEMTKVTLEDKLDQLRAVFPGKPSSAIKKLLDSTAGDVQQAIILGQSQGFTD